MDGQFVGSGRRDALETLLLLEECRLQEDEPRFKHGFYFRLRLVELVHAFAIDGDVEADVEDALGVRGEAAVAVDVPGRELFDLREQA